MKSKNDLKRKEMKKYFMCETGNELEFGDMIELDLTKEQGDGSTLHKVVNCKFHPMLVESLIEQGIIEEIDDEEEGFNVDDQVVEEFFEELIDGYVELNQRVTELEGEVANLSEKLKKHE